MSTNFTFATIGKQPDLLKRISAPHPNQVYQDNFTDPPTSPSPSQHQESPPSRPTLLQVLADPGESMAHPPIESTNRAPSLLGIFDKRAAALFAACMPNRPETSSQLSAPLRQVSASRDELMAESRFTSPDFIGSMELVYPPTEPATSPAPDFPGMPSSCAVDAHSASVADSTTLNSIPTSLEQDIQAVAAKSLLSLENARRAEALAQRSLATANESVATAKESVAIAQENTSLAQATKCLVDQILIGLAQLGLRCKDEATREQSCNLEYESEGSRYLFTEQGRDTQPTGLPPNVLHDMAVELAKKMREYDSRRGLRKRKRSQDHGEAAEGNDLPYLPHKERRIEQGTMSLDLVLEMEAEAARKAWGQEAERRSMVPSDTAPNATLGQQEQRTATKSHGDAQQVERGTSETGQLLNRPDQAGPANQITEQPVAALEQNLSSHQGVGPARGPEDIEDALQAQRRRELEERKLEIARFHIRERESQELQMRRKEMEKKAAAALIESQKKERLETGSTISSAPTSSNVMASKEVLPSAAQRKITAGDISKKKEVEQRLAMEKQQASAAVRPRPAQAGDATQMVAPQNHVDQPSVRTKERFPENQSDLQDRPQPLGDEKGDARKKQQEINEQQRNAEAEAAVKTRAQSTKFKERTNGASDASKSSKPKAIIAPIVGNVVAQQTLAMSPKMKGKKSRNPQTPVADTGDSSTQKSGPIPPAQGFGPPPRPHQALSVVNQIAPQNVRLSSVPPIECIIEPSSSDPSRMEAQVRPISQDRSGDLQRALHTKSSGTINVSPETQPANPRIKNSVPGTTTGQNASGHTARLPRVLTNTVVPKVEIQSPTIVQSTTIQHPLPPRAPSPNSNTPNALQLKTIRRPTPDDFQTPYGDRLGQSNEDAGHAGALDKNRRLNISSKKTVSSTPPIASPPASHAHRNLSPQDGQSTDMARNSQPINYEAQRTNQQNDPPPSHMAESLNASFYLRDIRASRGWAYEHSSISPPRSIGLKRPRISDRLDDMDGRHWSPGQEPLGRRDRLARRYNRRTPSGSPPLRFRGESPPRALLDRLDETQDPAVYRLNNGGETYRPFLSPANADMQRDRDDVNGYPGPSSDLRPPELLDRFSNTMPDGGDHPRQVRPGPQHPKRQNGTAPRGTARRGRRGGTLSLEQRLS